MKKNAIISYLLAISLLLSACIYRIPDNTQGNSEPALQESSTAAPSTDNKQPPKESESTPSTSDTSPSSQPSDESNLSATFDTYLPDSDDNVGGKVGNFYTEGPYTFWYVSFPHGDVMITGMALVECEDYVEEAVIPSEVCGIPVVAIGHYSDVSIFSETNNLKRLVIPNTVLYIGGRAFTNCSQLADITLSNSIICLGDSSPESGDSASIFMSTSVTFLDIPEGIKRLNEFVLDGPMVSIVLPASLEIVERYVFEYPPLFENTVLKEVFFRGTEEQCLQELKDQLAETEATLYYLSEEEPTEEGNFWHYVDGKPVIW